MGKILVVDDDQDINRLISTILKKKGHDVTSAYSGTEAELLINMNTYDLVILDLMLPGLTGEEVIERLRKVSNIPVIVLSAKGAMEDKVEVLNLGADDYITKPFNILEVKARIKAIMRRTSKSAATEAKSKTIEVGDLMLDCEGRRVSIAGKEINLTAKEFDVLELLVFNPNKVYSRENLLDIVWGYEYPGDVRTVDVHIRRLREKIESGTGKTQIIKTVWGVGYKIEA